MGDHSSGGGIDPNSFRRGRPHTPESALRLIQHTTRGELLAVAEEHCAIPWVRASFLNGSVTCHGVFNLRGLSEHPSWPVAILVVQRRSPSRSAVMHVYPHPEGVWVCATIEDARVPWERWGGDPNGAAGTVNGDYPWASGSATDESIETGLKRLRAEASSA